MLQADDMQWHEHHTQGPALQIWSAFDTWGRFWIAFSIRKKKLTDKGTKKKYVLAVLSVRPPQNTARGRVKRTFHTYATGTQTAHNSLVMFPYSRHFLERRITRKPRERCHCVRKGYIILCPVKADLGNSRHKLEANSMQTMLIELSVFVYRTVYLHRCIKNHIEWVAVVALIAQQCASYHWVTPLLSSTSFVIRRIFSLFRASQNRVSIPAWLYNIAWSVFHRAITSLSDTRAVSIPIHVGRDSLKSMERDKRLGRWS